MAGKLTREDMYFLLYISRYWERRTLDAWEDDEYHLNYRERAGLPILDNSRDRDRFVDIAKRILAVVRSYPPEEEEYEPETPEASEEVSSSENESVLGEQ